MTRVKVWSILGVLFCAIPAQASPESALTHLLGFRSETEAANASAHAAWAIALPLSGYAIANRKGAMAMGAAWASYSLANELAWHAPESSRERNLNLASRLIPCVVATLLAIVVGK